jgi:hypothetical protein
MMRPAIGSMVRVRYCGELVPATVTAHFGEACFTATTGNGQKLNYSMNDRIQAGQRRPLGWLPAKRSA